MGTFAAGLVFISINRGDYWQCAFAIPKGTMDELHRRGLAAFRDRIGRVVPFLAGRTAEITDWNQVKPLTVAVDRLKQWYRPGLLCIGDAAHAMSPIGGVGVNLAVQDAVATANLLAEPLRSGAVSTDMLRRVQDRRQFPAAVTQRIQIFLQNRLVAPTLGNTQKIEPPLGIRLLKYFPVLRRIPGRLIGLGVRPEHIRTPERASPSAS